MIDFRQAPSAALDNGGLRTTVCILMVFFAAFLTTLIFNKASKAQTSIAKPLPPSYQIEAVELDVNVEGQKARALLRHVIKNPGSAPMELDYLAPLPLNGAVAGLTLLRDGKELPGQVYDKDEAFRIYQEIVSRLKDPALIEYAGRSLYRARVFPLEPGKTATLELSLEWLLPKDDKRVDLVFPLAGPLTSGREAERQEVSVSIKGSEISGVYSPIQGVEISSSKDGAKASLKLSRGPAIPSFQLHYQEDAGSVGGLVLSHKPDADDDGYLLFLAEPAIVSDESPLPKTVVLVLDRSGSMGWEKMKQAVEALRFVLERLTEEDAFNIVDFSGSAKLYKPEIESVTPESRKAALEYVSSLRAGGSTNLGEALELSLSQVGEGQVAYVILLSDGEPTAGKTDEAELVRLAAKANHGARIFTFGVGYNVNARLLTRLSEEVGGAAAFVAPEESVEEKVSSLYTKISSPTLVKPSLAFSVPVNRLIPKRPPDLFLGSQMAMVGRYPAGGEAVATLRGEAKGGEMVFAYKTNLAAGPVPGGDFISRLWAERRVGELVEELDSLGGPELGSKAGDELISEIVDLAKRYGILTPYTSFLSLEDQNLQAADALVEQTRSNLSNLAQLTGPTANTQRRWRADVAQSLAPAPSPARPSVKEMREMKQEAALTDFAVSSSEAEMIPPTILAGRAFYQKSGQLVEGDLTEAEMGSIKQIARFSDEYFRLAKEMGPNGAVLLAQAEPVVFRHDGQAYLIQDEDS